MAHLISVFIADDFRRNTAPVLHATNIDFDITGTSVVLVDDVLQTGRTIRAALMRSSTMVVLSALNWP